MRYFGSFRCWSILVHHRIRCQRHGLVADSIASSCEQLSRSAYSDLASLADTYGMKRMSRCEKLSLGELVVVITNHV